MHTKKKYSPGKRNIIGAQIRKARLDHKPPVTQEELTARLAARGTYFDRTALSRMEAGRRFIRDYEIEAIAGALGITVGSLFERR